MYSFKEQDSVIKKVILRANSSKRIDFPFCGGLKTLSLSENQGRLLWTCYKASCQAKGIKDDKLSVDSIKAPLNSDYTPKKRSNPNEIPPLLSNIQHQQRQQLRQFRDITFALDKDVRKKSFRDGSKYFYGLNTSFYY